MHWYLTSAEETSNLELKKIKKMNHYHIHMWSWIVSNERRNSWSWSRIQNGVWERNSTRVRLLLQSIRSSFVSIRILLSCIVHSLLHSKHVKETKLVALRITIYGSNSRKERRVKMLQFGGANYWDIFQLAGIVNCQTI